MFCSRWIEWRIITSSWLSTQRFSRIQQTHAQVCRSDNRHRGKRFELHQRRNRALTWRGKWRGGPGCINVSVCYDCFSTGLCVYLSSHTSIEYEYEKRDTKCLHIQSRVCISAHVCVAGSMINKSLLSPNEHSFLLL